MYITGPTLLELKKIYGVEIDEISMINTIRAAAFTFGALSKLSNTIRSNLKMQNHSISACK